jgi:siroheme synthase-like protein
MPHQYLPIGFSLKDRKCLVVGGGNVAVRKVENLLDYDTGITVIAPQVHERIEYYAGKGLIDLEKRAYESPEAADFGLVIAASDDRGLNEQISRDCREQGVPVNVVDCPDLCDFIFPAVVRRDCLAVAVTTDGKAPFISGHLNIILKSIFPDHFKTLMKHAVRFRKMVMERWPDDPGKKNAAYGRFLEVDWRPLLKGSHEDEIETKLAELLESE